MDIAGDLGPRPGAREAHRKLNFERLDELSARCGKRGGADGSERDAVPDVDFTRGGDFLTEGRILKRLRARRGQK